MGTYKKIDMKERIKIGSEYSKRAYMIFKNSSEKIYQIACEEFKLSVGCLNLSGIYDSLGEKINQFNSSRKRTR